MAYGSGADCALESLLCSEDKNRSYTCCPLEIHPSTPRICPTHQPLSLNSLQVAGTSKKRSKDTWRSILGYLSVYPWIHCQVSLDTFSGQFRGFIQKNVDDDRDNFIARKQKVDGTSDLEERLNNYIVTERNNAVNTLAKDEDLDASVLNHYLSEYDYLQKEQPEIIQEALKEKHLGLIKKRKALTRILDKLRSIIRTFSWE